MWQAPPPYGYRLERSNKRRMEAHALFIDPEESEAAKTIF